MTRLKSGKNFAFFGIAVAAVASLALATGTAGAREALKLRGTVTVTEDVVRIGDLFENAGRYADRPVFRSPRPGGSGTLTASRIADALRNHGLLWKNRYRIHQVAVLREGITVPAGDIEKAIRDKLAAMSHSVASEDLALEFEGTYKAISLPTGTMPDPRVIHVNYNSRTGRFVAVVSGSPAFGDRYAVKYAGRATSVMNVPVLTRTKSRGERIGRADVAIVRMPKGRVGPTVLIDIEALVGQAARRTLRPDTPIRARDVENPKIVRKNTLVTVIYEVPGITLTAKARAVDDGARGEVITVRNPRSNRAIEVEVTGPDTVRAIVSAVRTGTLALNNQAANGQQPQIR